MTCIVLIPYDRRHAALIHAFSSIVCRRGEWVPSAGNEWSGDYHETDRCEFKTWWHDPSCASGVKCVPKCGEPKAACSEAA
jgi:hypothetical protein